MGDRHGDLQSFEVYLSPQVPFASKRERSMFQSIYLPARRSECSDFLNFLDASASTLAGGGWLGRKGKMLGGSALSSSRLDGKQ